MKRTKIVCTIGPSCDSEAQLAALAHAGMNVARLNLSHNTHAYHKRVLLRIRRVAKKSGEPLAVIADLQGPKIRVGALPKEGVQVKRGVIVELPVTYAGLERFVKPGHRILLDDGLLEGVAVTVAKKTMKLRMETSGVVLSHKGMNFPDSEIVISSLTAKDKEDVRFAVQAGADWIALSFVTHERQVRELKNLIQKAGGKITPRIIVKIEKHEALERFAEILKEVDGVMIARGDLGLEIPAEQVPIVQKQLIEECRLAGKPVVVATQMLASMERNKRATRAEVSDVANAVFDHTDAVMLSGETAVGAYPLEAVETMAQIVTTAEASPFDDVLLPQREPAQRVQAVSYALAVFANAGQVDGVIASTQWTPWAEQAFVMRPETRLFLAVPDESTARQVNIRWAAYGFVLKSPATKTFSSRAISQLKKNGCVKKGQRLLVVHGENHAQGFELVLVP